MSDSKKNIILESLSKSFEIGYVNEASMLSRAISFVSGKQQKKLKQVLSQISLEIYEGEILGIIGRNGSGKSTLLRLIAGIYSPDSGKVISLGNVVYINGLNYGIRQRLTMRENIYLVGAIMGLYNREIDSVFDDIVSFSGLCDYVDTKVYQFSSGMVSRLNFSIFIFFTYLRKCNVLLLDEIFAGGGDIDFKERAESKMKELLQSGVTVVLVSHNLSDIKKYCKRVVWLKNGSKVMDGEPTSIINQYILDKQSEI